MRGYEKPALNNKTIESVANKYIMKLLNNENWSLEMVVDFISRDYLYSKVEYYDKCISKVKYGYIKYRLNELDELLEDVQAVLNKPERFGLTKQNDIVTLFPHPVIKKYTVVDTEYSAVKSYYLPDYLFNYMILKEDISHYKNLTMHRQAEVCKFFREHNYKPAELSQILNISSKHMKKVLNYINNNSESIEAVTIEKVAEKLKDEIEKLYADHIDDELRELAEANGEQDKPKKSSKIINIDVDELVEFRNSGMSYKDLAEKYSCSTDTIIRRLRKANNLVNDVVEFKDSFDMVQVSADYTAGEKFEDIAKKFKTSPAYIKSRLSSYYGYEIG